MKRMAQTGLFAALLAAVALGLPHGAQAGSFNPEFSITLTDYEHDANADWTITFTIPDTDINYAKLLAFYPAEFFPADSGVPLGAKVGKEDPTTTLGLLNGPCNVPLGPHFDLYWASTDTSSTVTFSEQFEDSNGDGLHDGIDQYPDFLIRMLPGMTPVQRMYGDANMLGSLVSINFVVLEASALEAYPAAWGRPLVVVVNNMGDPAAEPTPGDAITDFCTPLSSNIGFFALSEDNPATSADEASYEVRRNPLYGGTYTFRWHLESMRDADGDGIENYLDTCPFDANLDNSPKVDTGPDNDGIDSACENSLRPADWDPTKPCWSGDPGLSNDCDKDGFYNRGDNCPLVANVLQEDTDTDDIGDACDPNPETPDGEPIVWTEETGVEISELLATPTPVPTSPIAPIPIATPTPMATPCPFSPTFSASVSEMRTPTSGTPDAYADVVTDFGIAAPDYNFEFEALVTFTPPQFSVAADGDVPDGAYVADVDTLATVGLLNNPCNTALPVTFTMLDCATNTADTVSFEDGFADADGNGLPDACDKYPDFLKTMFPSITPRARMLGPSSVAGVPVSLNMLVFEPGTALPGLPSFDASLGYPSVFVLNDPTAPPDPGQPITDLSDFCTPMEITTTMFGVSKDNPDTAGDESGFVVRAKPSMPGQYVFTAYVRSLPDADGDCIENGLDSCPYDANAGDPRVAASGDDDMDGIDNVCDPEPDVANPDQDRDFYLNRGDNCPLVPNGRNQDNQADADSDGIGDACDLNPDKPDGESISVALEATVDIREPATPTPGVIATPTLAATPAAVPAGGLGAEPPESVAWWPLLLLAAGALLPLTAGAWYARRRWLG